MTRAAQLPPLQAQRRTTIAQRPIEWVEMVPAGSVASLLPAPHRVFRAGGLRLIVSKEPTGWHLSVSHPRRYPTWDEIADARYRFVPDEITMAMLLPPRGEYVNVHERCLHLHEIDPRVRVVVVDDATMADPFGPAR